MLTEQGFWVVMEEALLIFMESAQKWLSAWEPLVKVLESRVDLLRVKKK